MKIHHLNCGSLHPFGVHLVAHCLLIESPEGLILVDTGFGLQDVLKPWSRLNPFSRFLLRPELLAQETAYHQITQLGLRPEDVSHIVLTHLDFDHAGGLDDFPNAQVHLMDAERQSALAPANMRGRFRYSAGQLKNSSQWNTYYAEGEKWFGFEAVRELKGLPPEILLVPLAGHSAGHTGVAVQTDQGWILHAGDAYYFKGELENQYSCPTKLRYFQKWAETGHKMRTLNLLRLRDLAASETEDIILFCSHDPDEFLKLKQGPPQFLKKQNSFFKTQQISPLFFS